MSKSPEMEKILNDISKRMYGRERNSNMCVVCGSDKVKPTDFKDNLSRKEYTISYMCQKCQDKVFFDNGEQ
jgi:hypothetical protein